MSVPAGQPEFPVPLPPAPSLGAAPSRFDCRIAGQVLRHEPPRGSLAICPAGLDCAAEAQDSVDAILIAIDPPSLALAAAENSALEAQLQERLSGCDEVLFDLARTLASESTDGYPNGPLFWNEVASGFVCRLIARHTSGSATRTRGMLGKDVLELYTEVKAVCTKL